MLLAIDTSTAYAGVCLYDGGVLLEVTWRSGRDHTVQVAAQIDSALRQQRVAPSDLSGVAVAIGPGSFSGVRAGVALAKSIALALGIRLVGICTLDAIACGSAIFAGAIRPVIDGGRGQIATALYRTGSGAPAACTEPALADLASLLPVDELTLFCGEISVEQVALIGRDGGPLARVVGSADRARRAGYLAELASERLDRGLVDDPLVLQPVYLRRPAVLDRMPAADDATQPRSSLCRT